MSINKKKSLVSAKSFNKAASYMEGELDNDADEKAAEENEKLLRLNKHLVQYIKKFGNNFR